ncbi:unnamed protein product, partial [Allacma fusca]
MSNPRNFMMNPTVPRSAPRIPVNPTPFNFEKPTPQVPEVSLIFDTSMQNGKHGSTPLLAHPLPTAVPQPVAPHCPPTSSQIQQAQYVQPNNFEVRVLYDVIKKQEESIMRLENNLKLMSENQDLQWKNIQGLLTTLLDRSSVKKPHLADQAVQTENFKEITPKLPIVETEAKPVNTGSSMQIQTKTCVTNVPRVERSRSSSSSSSSASSSL